MANPNSIKGKGFESRPNDINKNGRPIGSKNRSTTLKKWLKCKINIKNPETGNVEKVSLEDSVVLALIKKANSGDVSAIKEIQDTLFGKIQEKLDHSSSDGTMSPKNVKITFK